MSESDPDRAGARADLCRLLSACYYEPSPDFVEERLFESMAQAAARIDPQLAELAHAAGQAFAAEDQQTLLVDYTRLFLGPLGAPAKPYGSVWLGGTGELMQASTMAVLDLYREGGFDVADDFRDLPDHVAIELEFLYVLLFREAQSWHDGDLAARGRILDLRARFLREHLGRWIGAFADACSDNAQTGFYRELGRLTGRFVSQEARRDGAA